MSQSTPVVRKAFRCVLCLEVVNGDVTRRRCLTINSNKPAGASHVALSSLEGMVTSPAVQEGIYAYPDFKHW
jgi:hypothetical protein